MSQRLSEHASIDLMDLADIGGTNAQNNGGWLSMKNYSRVLFYVEIGTWDSSDDLDECRLQQASDSSGTGAKDLTSDASGGNYDTDSPIDSDSNFALIEARGEDMDQIWVCVSEERTARCSFNRGAGLCRYWY
jgi:hypothetical protein